MDNFDEMKSAVRGDKNYYSLITTLFGIIDKNETQFNGGLALQLEFYESEAKGELKDTDEEFICDDAVALTNLALSQGLELKTIRDLTRGIVKSLIVFVKGMNMTRIYGLNTG